MIAVVTFHSIEDKIVKFFFKHYSEQRNSSRYLPEADVSQRCFKLIKKKPILPSSSEIRQNPPSRSAKLRAVQRSGTNKIDTKFIFQKFKYIITVFNHV